MGVEFWRLKFYGLGEFFLKIKSWGLVSLKKNTGLVVNVSILKNILTHIERLGKIYE